MPEPDTRPRKGDKGVPDDLERRYRQQNDGRGVGDYVDEAYADGLAAGSRSSGAGSSGRGLSFRRPQGIPSVAAPMLVELALITADEFLNARRPPVPSRLLVVFVVFGTLGLAKGDAAEAAAAMGWGLVVATFYASSKPKQPPAALKALAGIGNFLSGKYAPRGSSKLPIGRT